MKHLGKSSRDEGKKSLLLCSQEAINNQSQSEECTLQHWLQIDCKLIYCKKYVGTKTKNDFNLLQQLNHTRKKIYTYIGIPNKQYPHKIRNLKKNNTNVKI